MPGNATSPITEFGNPILTRKAKRVTRAYLKSSEFKKLIATMKRVMRRADGVGIAAPQIGVPLQVAILEIRATKERPELGQGRSLVVVNPEIISYEGAISEKWEGCLSFNKVFGKVPRSARVTVTYLNEDGEKITEKAAGLWAHIFQHEVDHLQGVRFVDRMTNNASFTTKDEYRKQRAARKK